MAVSKRRAKTASVKRINNKAYPIVITTFDNGTFSKVLKSIQHIKEKTVFDKVTMEIKTHKARSIEHCTTINK